MASLLKSRRTPFHYSVWKSFLNCLRPLPKPRKKSFSGGGSKEVFSGSLATPGLLQAILDWVSSQIFGFFSFSVLLGISFVLETNSLVIVNPKNDRIVLRPGIHLPAETAGIRRYGRYSRYFFWYETGGVPVPVHWLVRYIPASTVRYWLPCAKMTLYQLYLSCCQCSKYKRLM